MDALTYISTKFGVSPHARGPVELPGVGRDDLARLFHLLGFRRGAEIGVERGLFSRVLCEMNPGVELFAIDPWKAYRGYRDHVNQAKLDRFCDEARAALAPFPRARILRAFSVEAARTFKDGQLDFVYIDGNHSLPSVIADLAAWTPKVRPGGIIAGHDYVRYKLPNQIHVVQAIGAWTSAYEISPWFILGTKAKRDGEVRDTARSWFWVKAEERRRLGRGRGRVKQ